MTLVAFCNYSADILYDPIPLRCIWSRILRVHQPHVLLWIFSGVVFLPIFVMLTNYKEALATALRHRYEPIQLEEIPGERNPRNVRKAGAQ